MPKKNERELENKKVLQKTDFTNNLYKYNSFSSERVHSKSEDFINEYLNESHNILIPALENLSQLSNKEEVFNQLNSISWDFYDNETSYLTHDIHPYPAKFIPQIPSNIITALSLPGELIWDPFGGSGTTALESLLLNRRCISTDANPLSSIIGECKVLTLCFNEQKEMFLYIQWLESLLANVAEIISYPNFIPDIPNINKWFHDNAITELSMIHNSILNLSDKCKIVTKIALSRTVAKISNQESETRYSSKPKDIKKTETIRCFISDLNTVLSKIIACGNILHGRNACFKTFDLRQPINESSPIKENQIDLIVTSPPYANATDYHLYHRFRMFWLGYDPINFGKSEIGSHLRHQKEKTGFNDYIDEVKLCLKNCFTALKYGRYAVFVLGDSVFNKVVYDTTNAYRNVAEDLGFEFVGIVERNLPTNKRSFESPARRATTEKILILRKPPVIHKVVLTSAPYKLWDYEEKLLNDEIEKIFKIKPKKVDNKSWEININSYDIDKLRNLTFIHELSSETIYPEYTWQRYVENGDVKDNVVQRKESKYLTHGIHEYKGKFYPQLCKSLLNLANIKPGSTVLDPFLGSGTTILESYLSGYRAYGCDMNPLAVRIARSKVELLDINPLICIETLKTFHSTLKNSTVQESESLYNNLSENAKKELISWFPPNIISKLSFILENINRIPDTRFVNFLSIILSNLVRDVSQQDPTDLRIRRRKTPIEDAPIIEMFLEQLITQISKLESFFSNFQHSPRNFQRWNIWNGNSTSLENFRQHGLNNSSVDAIITSPPYATALPYIDTNRLSLLLLLGLNSTERDIIENDIIGTREIKTTAKKETESLILANDFGNIVSPYSIDLINRIHKLNSENNVGFRRKNMASLLYKYFSSMTSWMSTMDALLKKGSPAFIVIGNNVTSSLDVKINIESTTMLKETAQHLNWNLVNDIPISVTTENLKHSSNSIKENSILWFIKE